jgi:hypothetical protein
MTGLTYQNILEVLRTSVPGLAQLYEEHLAKYDEPLPHVLFGDLVRFLEQEVRLNGPYSPVLAQAIGVLERAMGSQDPKLQELVAVSFIENLEPESPTLGAFRRLFGPNLAAQSSAYRAGHKPR